MIVTQRLDATPFKRHPHFDLLKSVGIFSHLSDQALGDLLKRMSVRRWHGGAIIVGQNEPGDALYILVQGKVKVVLFGETGREMTLATLSAGDFFGELSLVDGRPCSANVVAMEDSLLLALDRDAFLGHLAASPETALRLLRSLAGKLRRSNELINNLALHDVTSRLTRTLVAMAQDGGEIREDGILIKRRPTQQDLANMVGTCRETVSRALSSMARRGLVVSRGRSLLLSRALIESWRQAA
jgi:CRP/FNR family transcriptional regulator, cyclic AMP receptor protein